ncbi:MAG: LytTR family DNA-binding domain-containing protein [Muribaculaceae bacterium]|nr:LytTR family DNA-binding domain-containing protein [Muribaculaceae bacterium]
MNYVIIENDARSLRRIKSICEQLRPQWNLVFTSESVEGARSLFSQHEDIDLALCDIELNDGLVFSLLRHVNPDFPVIFVTAYDEYTLEAFKLESIDYLLKPIETKALECAFEKYERREKRVRQLALETFARLEASLQKRNFISRLLISINDRFDTLSVNEVAFFLSEDKYVFAITRSGREHITSFKSLSELEPQLDPDRFFRISREIIASIESIEKVSRWFKGKLLVKIAAGETKREVTVSSARRNDFLSWFGK